MKNYLPNIPLLATAQLMMMSALTCIVSTSSLVGYDLASDKSLATLPYALMFIAAIFVSAPAALLMRYVGRNYGFMLAALFGMLGAALCSYAIFYRDFQLFCIGSFAVGIFNAFGQYFRFAAADSVPPQQKSQAVSYVLAAGIIAAFIGPFIAIVAKDWLISSPFAGSYAVLLGLYLIVFITVKFLQPDISGEETTTNRPPRPLMQVVSQPKFIIALISATLGYATMTLIMTASPLAMQHYAHGIDESSWVIQWHVIGMFAPSFFTGTLIQRYGTINVILMGSLLLLLAIFINLNGVELLYFWSSLFLLGAGWNFVFIGATTLLTETYRPSERFKAQAFNDGIVFTAAALAALSSGKLQHLAGWESLNYFALPAVLLIMFMALWDQLKPCLRITHP